MKLDVIQIAGITFCLQSFISYLSFSLSSWIIYTMKFHTIFQLCVDVDKSVHY